MDVVEYQQRALAMEADQEALTDWVYQQGAKGTRLANAARGLADDAGEVNGAVKKWLEYKQPLDEVNLLEEVGDCLWRLAQVCEALGLTLGDAMAANLRKLEEVRYKRTRQCNPQDAAEQNRDRAAERAAILGKFTAPLTAPVVEEPTASFGDALRRRVEDDGVAYPDVTTLGGDKIEPSQQTKICDNCGCPLSDELVRKLSDPNFRLRVFICPECREPLTYLGLKPGL